MVPCADFANHVYDPNAAYQYDAGADAFTLRATRVLAAGPAGVLVSPAGVPAPPPARWLAGCRAALLLACWRACLPRLLAAWPGVVPGEARRRRADQRRRPRPPAPGHRRTCGQGRRPASATGAPTRIAWAS